MSSEIDSVLDLLNKPFSDSSCGCSECKQILDKIGTSYTCKVCGYNGRMEAIQCACYDGHCSPSARGYGCFHGCVGCPVCADGDESGWDLVKRIRKAIAKC